MRAGLALPALGVLDPGDRAPDSVVEEGDLRRLVRIRRDPRDERVHVRVAALAEVQRPQHPVAAQPQLVQENDESPLDLPRGRLLPGPPGQHEVLDRRTRPRGACHRGDQFGDLACAGAGDEMETAARKDVAAVEVAAIAIDIAGEILDLPRDRRAVAALVHALADHAGDPDSTSIARRIARSARRASSRRPGFS